MSDKEDDIQSFFSPITPGDWRAKTVRTAEIIVNDPDELSIDGSTRPAGNIEVREYEDGEWVGGQYFKTIEAANEHVSRYLSHSLDEDSYYRD